MGKDHEGWGFGTDRPGPSEAVCRIINENKLCRPVMHGFSGEALEEVFKHAYLLGEKNKVKQVVLDSVRDALETINKIEEMPQDTPEPEPLKKGD